MCKMKISILEHIVEKPCPWKANYSAQKPSLSCFVQARPILITHFDVIISILFGQKPKWLVHSVFDHQVFGALLRLSSIG